MFPPAVVAADGGTGGVLVVAFVRGGTWNEDAEKLTTVGKTVDYILNHLK